MVHDSLGHDKLSSAFQIRYRGCKGVLSPDPTLKDKQVIFRKSMVKFDCPNSSNLEVVKTSKPSPLRLNRPLITLLNGLGVDSRIFERLQEEMLQTLTDMMFDEEKAANYLQKNSPTRLCNFKDISQSGIHLTMEPFFRSLLLALYRHRLEGIKTRAHIAIDKGRNMLGILDETNTLNYGEVFVQYTKDASLGETSEDTHILTGEVVVTKYPCLNPGDVRKFKAVDVPELHDKRDCIVFPQRGPRPHPNEMGGSDLDGDEYAVIWLEDLIFEKENQEPAHFPAVNSHMFGHIGTPEMIQFFEEYIEKDNAGLIAIAHLVEADRNGIFSKKAQTIARKFSIAIDFNKSGYIEQLLESEKPKRYPDFMESERHQRTYRSKTALGRMYRNCKDFESEYEAISIKHENIECDPDLVYPGWEKYKDSAIMAKNKYNTLLKCILRNYGDLHEAEALSGGFSKFHCRFEERRNRHEAEIEKIVFARIKRLIECMYQEFLEFADVQDANDFVNSKLQKASAWYVVTYSLPEANFLSFPWIVSEYLIQIKLRNTPLANPPILPPVIMKLDEKLLELNFSCHIGSEVWNGYHILCETEILELALLSVILWSQEEGIIKKLGRKNTECNIPVQLFLHVAETLGYLTKDDIISKEKSKNVFSPGLFLVQFLKFCSNFRFLTKDQMDKTVPFSLPNYQKLSKRAVASYHKFAMSGTFRFLEIDKQTETKLVVMKTVYKNRKVFASLENAAYILQKISEVHEVSLRETQRNKVVCISAKGTEYAVKNLKMILDESDRTLKKIIREAGENESINRRKTISEKRRKKKKGGGGERKLN